MTQAETQAQAALQDLKQSLTHYRQILAATDKEVFEKKPVPEQWSVAQLMEHLCTATTYFFGKRVHYCLSRNTEKGKEGGSLSEAGEYVMEKNRFPQKQIKIPGAGHVEYDTRDVATYQGWLDKIEEEFTGLAPKVAADEGTFTVHHPYLGDLNALHYYRNHSMHWKHHEEQLQRILTAING